MPGAKPVEAAKKSSSFLQEEKKDAPAVEEKPQMPMMQIPFFWPYMMRFPGLPWPAHQLLPGYELITQNLFSTPQMPAMPGAKPVEAAKKSSSFLQEEKKDA